jgi:3-oxoacyl-[acyl-carrier protein] reductase
VIAFAAQRYQSGAAAIAGGSGGLGRAIARVLAEAGARIAVTWNRNRAPAEELVEELGGADRAAAFQVDLRKPDAVLAFHDAVRTTFGGLHTAVYAAGPYIDMRYISSLDPSLF